MRLRGGNTERARYLLWPISFGWRDDNGVALTRYSPRRLLAWHGWQVGYERVPESKTSLGCMPGIRSVFGQTVHIGSRLMIFFGKVDDAKWRRT